MKRFLIGIICTAIIGVSCKTTSDTEAAKVAVNATLDGWHQAAALANYNKYFSYMTKDAVFIGSDPTENWKGISFKDYCKPHFDKGKAWNFTPIERNIYFNTDNTVVWFDELLNTQMKLCRGSGVMLLENNIWKIRHYTLSMTVPNENTKEVVALKTRFEDSLVRVLQNNKF
jgi:hypothetical protein